MKNSLLVSLLLFSFSQLGKSQIDNVYVPMDTITDWYVSYGSFGGSGTYYYQDIGDTIINGQDYRMIRPEPYESVVQTRYIREDRDQRIVYQYNAFNEEVSVLYDFTLTLGDVYSHYTGDYTVIEIDTISSPLGTLTRWKLDGPGPFIYYTEAIGSEDLFLGNTLSDPVFFLQCAHSKDLKVFGDDTCETPPRWSPSFTEINVSICEGDSYFFDNTIIAEAGTYIDTLSNTNGVDSIITLNLELLPLGLLEINETLCSGSAVEVGGVVFDETSPSGNVIISGGSANGCDSIVNVDLSFIAVIVSGVEATICEGESFIFNNEELNSTGLYTFTFNSISGCDSIVNLELDVLENSFSFLSVSICEGETFSINDLALTETGQYESIIESTNGCDSLISINLEVFPNYLTIESLEFCPGDSIVITNPGDPDVIITGGGVFNFNYSTSIGCDSLYSLEVIELPESECATNTYDLQSFALDIFPNPFDDSILLSTEETIKSIEVTSISGVKIDYVNNINETTYSYDGSQLSTGVYILTLRSEDKIAIQRIVKN